MYHYKPFALVNLVLAVYLGFNIYAAFNITNIPLFVLLLFLFTQSYWIVRYVSYRADRYLVGLLFLIVSACFSLFTLALIYTVLADIVWLVLFLLPHRALIDGFHTNITLVGTIVFVLTVVTYFIGLYNARNPRIITYNISTEKPLPKPLKIVLIADVHLNSYTSKKLIQQMVNLSNSVEPDMVLFAGDILDGEAEPFLKRGFDGVLRQLSSRYGTYAVLGNHEYYSFAVDDMIDAYEKSGMTVLRDKVMLFDELNMALIGRDDYMSYMFGMPRKPMKEIVKEAPENMLRVLLEHQPRNSIIARALENGIDVQLSGHTHNGQAFPMNYMLKAVYKKAWGLWQKGKYSLVVTCGFGTWGVNIRTFSVSEIACINIRNAE